MDRDLWDVGWWIVKALSECDNINSINDLSLVRVHLLSSHLA